MITILAFIALGGFLGILVCMRVSQSFWASDWWAVGAIACAAVMAIAVAVLLSSVGIR
jgi:hypothetical protein